MLHDGLPRRSEAGSEAGKKTDFREKILRWSEAESVEKNKFQRLVEVKLEKMGFENKFRSEAEVKWSSTFRSNSWNILQRIHSKSRNISRSRLRRSRKFTFQSHSTPHMSLRTADGHLITKIAAHSPKTHVYLLSK